MKLTELYSQTPVARHGEILVAGDRVFFEGEEHLIQGDGSLKLIRSQKMMEQSLSQIGIKLDAK